MSDSLEMTQMSESVSPDNHDLGKAPSTANRRDYLVGIVLLILVVLLWTSSNFLTQDLFEGGYEKPFLVTYLNTASFSLYLIPFFFRRWRERGHETDGRQGYRSLPSEPSEHVQRSRSPYIHRVLENHDTSSPLTIRETAQLAWIFCFFWFIANWSVNASLDFTSVASSTILASMSGFFTLMIGRIFRVETFTLVKLAAVVISFSGVLLVSLSDSDGTNQPASPPSLPLPGVNGKNYRSPNALIGDLLALLSALFYALYVILLKVRIRSESRINMQLFFGFVGLFNIVSCWPIGLILHFTDVERWEFPQTSKAWVAVLVNMALTLTSDFIYVLAMLKTTPLVVTIGLSLTIPVAVVGDFILGKENTKQALLGALLVLLSFVIVGLENARIEVPLEGDEGERGRTRIRTSHDVSRPSAEIPPLTPAS